VEGPFRRADLTDPALRLIETIRWDGRGMPLWPCHSARLSGAAARFGWPCNPGAAEAALRAAARPGQPMRLRLTLDATGGTAIEAGPLPPSPPVWRLGLARAVLDPADPWLTVKSTRRAAYDAARAALPDGCDEAVFLNPAGEVCDGTITTLFFDRGGGLCTPPLSCGLLPGVLRAARIAAGTVREEPLPGRDLPRVRLWVGNALRGLMPARWAG
jgi:4-amino-4-deoxychorismate lyase